MFWVYGGKYNSLFSQTKFNFRESSWNIVLTNHCCKLEESKWGLKYLLGKKINLYLQTQTKLGPILTLNVDELNVNFH